MQLSQQELEKLTMTVQDMVTQSGADRHIGNALKYLGYKTGAVFVGQLLCYTPSDLVRSHFIGPKICTDIAEMLAYNGLRMASLEAYSQELIHKVWDECPRPPEDVAARSGVADICAARSKKAFGLYLQSLEEKAPEIREEGPSHWFAHHVSKPPIRGMLEKKFMNSVLAKSVASGRVGLVLNDLQPRMA